MTGRPRGLTQKGTKSDVAWVYGLRAKGTTQYVYVGVTINEPNKQLVSYKRPSAREKGHPNIKTSVWIEEHLDNIVFDIFDTLQDVDGTQRRAAQEQWIAKLAKEGHPLLNSEVAGRSQPRPRKAKPKPVQPQDDADWLAEADKGTVEQQRALATAHQQWHVARNAMNDACPLCWDEPKAWQKKVRHYTVNPTGRSAEEHVRLVGVEPYRSSIKPDVVVFPEVEDEIIPEISETITQVNESVDQVQVGIAISPSNKLIFTLPTGAETARENRLEKTLNDVLEQLAFLTEFVKNELNS